MESADLTRLFAKLRAIEALYARPGTDGERVAAQLARDRLLERIAEASSDQTGPDVPIEYRFTMADGWSRRVFVALLRKHGIRPYRYHRQRRTTVMANVSPRFVDETLWPQFVAFSDTLRAYLDQVTARVVADVLHADGSDATVVDESTPSLPAPEVTPPPAPSYVQLDLAAHTSVAHDAPAPEANPGTSRPPTTSAREPSEDPRSKVAAAAEAAARERRRKAAERKRKKRDRKAGRKNR